MENSPSARKSNSEQQQRSIAWRLPHPYPNSVEVFGFNLGGGGCCTKVNLVLNFHPKLDYNQVARPAQRQHLRLDSSEARHFFLLILIVADFIHEAQLPLRTSPGYDFMAACFHSSSLLHCITQFKTTLSKESKCTNKFSVL